MLVLIIILSVLIVVLGRVLILVLIVVLIVVFIVVLIVLAVLVFGLIVVLVLHNEALLFVIWNYVLIMPHINRFYAFLCCSFAMQDGRATHTKRWQR